MKKLLEFIAKSILEHPKDVKITEEEDKEAGIVRLTLSVHPDDIGRAIGKEGRIANAVRNLLRVIAIREGKRVFLDITTPENAKKSTGTEKPATTEGTEDSAEALRGEKEAPREKKEAQKKKKAETQKEK